MPRFFLHSEQESSRAVDEEGIDAADVEAARRIAIKAASDIAADALCRGAERVCERIVIANDEGREVATVAVQACVRIDG